MKVRLVAYTQPAAEIAEQGITDLLDLVAFCARVSNPSNQMNTETSEKLCKYLLKHKHFSPFEMVNVTMELTTTRDIARQILRHRSFSFQEYSQRYADPTDDLYFVVREARLQDPKNRQNSIELGSTLGDANLQEQWLERQRVMIAHAMETYKWAVDQGIAKEQARAVLPEGLTVSKLYMSGSLRSWIHYIQLRSENGTQKEHIAIAQACAEVIAKIFPMMHTIHETSQ